MLMKKDWFQYTLLILVLVAGVYLYRLYPGSLQRFYIVCATSILYVAWGIYYHLMHERLQLWIVTEYLLMASLVIAFFAFSLKLG
ncbi:hypothetical protein COT49_01825 [candidate division WWE3 bacterium CG08_land_8_20_14_0_20_40_13]|uniref:Uncharacterized protein n=1 Tax=candidate division WWE3 bacterium CG08_land_8_20_14_0_20_40_13 TaxID=1975084 RepID=A0A2H0XE40_UNCKA|nr:MAG: hypothetical protein COT49_01825 [candidate division WWE3 bacterium CG08_land_8_20_14_0_20_40_13]